MRQPKGQKSAEGENQKHGGIWIGAEREFPPPVQESGAEGAASQKLPDDTHGHQGHGVAQSLSETVRSRGQDAVFGRQMPPPGPG